MKVCFIGPFADGTGYSKAGIEYVLSLDAVGVDVVARSVKMTNTTGELPDRFKELTQKDLMNVDAVFQYNLPSEFAYKGGVQNICGFAYETNGFPNTDWMENIQMMDKVVVPCNQQKSILSEKIQKNTFVVPHSVDVKKFDQQYDTLTFGLSKDTLKFYTISEYSRRKNLEALILAYLSSFTSYDNVVLIIKSHVPQRDAQHGSHVIKQLVNEMRSGLRKFENEDRYPPIIVISSYMSERQIMSLHQSCDVFVSASHGESWCLPAVDALGFGNRVIAPNDGAFKDYIQDWNGTLVSGTYAPVFGVTGVPKGLYTGEEEWFNISTKELSLAMKNHYDAGNWFLNTKEHKMAIDVIKSKYSRESVGNKLKEVIDANPS